MTELKIVPYIDEGEVVSIFSTTPVTAWGVDKINAPKAWLDNQGEGIVVAVLDTGINKSHEIFAGQILDGRNFSEVGTIDDYSDFNGHGTHVAGTIAGKNENVTWSCGVAPKAKLIIGKISHSGSATIFAMEQGIRWATSWVGPNGEKVDVINMSFTTSESKTLERAMKDAVEKGISFVVAAGNIGDNNNFTQEHYYLQNFPQVISVANFTSSDTVYSNSNSNGAIAVAAPGTSITSASYLSNTTYRNLTGTSMASPHVAGMMAIIHSVYEKLGKKLTATEAKKILIEQYTRKLQYDYTIMGAGMIDFNTTPFPKTALKPLKSSREFFPFHPSEIDLRLSYVGGRKWVEKNRGENTVIAILSTGIDTNHPSLRNQVIDGINYSADYEGLSTNYIDNNGIGTACAGVISSTEQYIGIATHSKLLSIKVQNSDLSFSADAIINGLNWAKNWRGPNGEKVDVILTTFFYSSIDAVYSRHADIQIAMQEMANNQIILVSGTGNTGDANLTTIEDVYPARDNAVLSISSMRVYMHTGGTLNDYKSSINSSNYYIDLAAPGEGVEGTKIGGTFGTHTASTSIAAAYVAGGLALIISTYHQNNIVKNADEIKNILKEYFVRPIYGNDTRQLGYGILDLNWKELPGLLNEIPISNPPSNVDGSLELDINIIQPLVGNRYMRLDYGGMRKLFKKLNSFKR